MSDDNKMMRVSHNEILMLCRKSFEGLGFSAGEADDAAEMVAWLEVHGIDVLGLLCDALPTLTPETQPPPLLGRAEDDHAVDYTIVSRPQSSVAGNSAGHCPQIGMRRKLLLDSDRHCLDRCGLLIVDAQGGSALFAGPLLAELGAAETLENGCAAIKVFNCRYPLLLLGLATSYARRGIGMEVWWHIDLASQKMVRFAIEPNEMYPTLKNDGAEDALLCDAYNPVALIFSTQPTTPTTPKRQPPRSVITPADFAQRFVNRRDRGIEIQDAPWTILNQYAKNILVEATEESRRRGAGEDGG